MSLTADQMDRKIEEHFGYEAADNVEGVLATLAPDATHDIVGYPTGPTRGRDNARGFYAQMLWGIRPLLVAGIRGESASGDEGAFAAEQRADRWRVSPSLTWFPTEFSKVRLQYNYDDRESHGVDHSVWMQIEFLLGAHAAHQF